MILKKTLKNNAGNGNTTAPQLIELVMYWAACSRKKNRVKKNLRVQTHVHKVNYQLVSFHLCHPFFIFSFKNLPTQTAG